MRRILNDVGLKIKSAWVSLLVYEILFKMFITLCIVPIVYFVFNFSLKMLGYSYITKRTLQNLFKNPIVIISIIIILIISAIVVMIKLSGLISFIGQDVNDTNNYLEKLMRYSLRQFKRNIHPRNIGIWIYTLMSLPIFNVIAIVGYAMSSMEISERIFSYIKEIRYYQYIGALLVIVFYIIVVKYIFVYCYYFIEQLPVKESFKKAKQLIHKRFLKTMFAIVICNVAFFIVYLLFYLVVIVVVSIFVRLIGNKDVGLTIFLLIFNITNKGVLLVLSSFELIVNVGVIVTLYKKYSGIEVSHNYDKIEKVKLKEKLIVRRNFRDKLPKRVKRIFLIGFIVLIVANTASVYLFMRYNADSLKDDRIQITSHRGNSSVAPENTIYAMEAAVKDLANYAEIDVQQTKDGVLVIFHDNDLKRVAKTSGSISSKTYDEIKDLDVGSWFSKDFSDARIPTLEEVVQYSKGKIKLNIELKATNKPKDFEKNVVRVLEENDFVGDCVVTSFDYASLTKIKKLNSKIKTGCILSPIYGKFYDMKYIDFYSLEKNFVTPRMVYQIHQRGKEVHIWTVNSEYYFKKMEELGVDNIITDDPVLARNTLYSKNLPDYTVKFLKLIFNLE